MISSYTIINPLYIRGEYNSQAHTTPINQRFIVSELAIFEAKHSFIKFHPLHSSTVS